MRSIWCGMSVASIAACGVLAWSSALADGGAAFLGANFGRARNEFDTGQIDRLIDGEAASANVPVNLSARSAQKLSDVWWIDAGYLFSPYLGVDAAFIHLGEIKYIVTGTATEAAGPQPLSDGTEIISHGPALSVLGRLPIGEHFALDARIGDYYGKTVQDSLMDAASSRFSTASKSRSSLLGGVGASVTFFGHASLRLDFLHVQKTGDSTTLGKFNVNLATAGVSYTF